MPCCKKYLYYYYNRGNRGTERFSIFSHAVQPEWGAERQAVEPGSSLVQLLEGLNMLITMPALQKATISLSCCYKCYALLPQLLEAYLVPDGGCVYVKKLFLRSSHTAASSAPLGTQPCSTTNSIHSILALFSGQLSACLSPWMAGTSGLSWLRSPQRIGNAAV